MSGWKREGRTVYELHDSRDSRGRVVTENRWQAGVSSIHLGDPELERIARLIAAAPAMAALLRKVVAENDEEGIWLDGITDEARALLATLPEETP